MGVAAIEERTGLFNDSAPETGNGPPVSAPGHADGAPYLYLFGDVKGRELTAFENAFKTMAARYKGGLLVYESVRRGRRKRPARPREAAVRGLGNLIVEEFASSGLTAVNRAMAESLGINGANGESLSREEVILMAGLFGHVGVIESNAPVIPRKGTGSRPRGWNKRGPKPVLFGRGAMLYRRAERLLSSYRESLTDEKNACLRFFLLTEKQNKFQRIANCYRGGFLEKNKRVRFSRLLFGRS